MAVLGLPDIPLAPDAADYEKDDAELLGLHTHASALASFIKNCATPMTIGIQGAWGSGKTSLMRLIVRENAADTWHVWFNTWQYSQFGHAQNLSASMLLNLLRQLQDLQKESGGWGVEAQKHLKRFARGVLTAVGAITRGAAGALAGSAGMQVDGDRLLSGFSDSGDAVDDARLFETMKEDFAKIVEPIVKNGGRTEKRIVFYIDDLDRLEPARAVELLEVMKNLVDVSGCVFVLAIDYDVILRGLKQQKGYDARDMQAEGKSFFDKIIQVPYRMPVASYGSEHYLIAKLRKIRGRGRIGLFLNEKEGAVRARQLLSCSIGNNPRSIKRLLNLHALLGELAKIKRVELELSKQRSLDSQHWDQLLVVTCIQMAHFDLYQFLARHQAAVDHLLVALTELSIIANAATGRSNEPWDEDGSVVDEAARQARRDYAATIDADPDSFEQAVDDVATLVRGLKLNEQWTERRATTWPILARLLFSAVDQGKTNGKFDLEEREHLQVILDLAAATSVQDTTEDVNADRERPLRVNFRQLAAGVDGDAPLLVPGEKLRFDDGTGRAEAAFETPIEVEPDCDYDGARAYVMFNGSRTSLAQVTKEAFKRLQQAGQEVVNNELRAQLGAARYWVPTGRDTGETLADLIQKYRAARTTLVGPDGTVA